MKENKGGTTMRGFTLSCGLAVLLCLPMSVLAQDAEPDAASNLAPDTTYTFTTVNHPGDNFTQLLGINNVDVIAGYHGSGATGHPNRGFTLILPNIFTPENFPGAMQTQVIGINNVFNTAGFYIDGSGANHGFLKLGSTFVTVDFPGTTSVPKVNQLLGLNTKAQSSGFYNDKANNSHGYIYARFGGVFLVFTIPGATSAQATGVNNLGQVSGFYTDTAGITHGFWLNQGQFKILNFPGAASTMAFGLNNVGKVVGTYTDHAGLIHGFVWTNGIGFQGVDDPHGVGATFINGINDKGVIVGFYGPCASGTPCNGFVATP